MNLLGWEAQERRCRAQGVQNRFGNYNRGNVAKPGGVTRVRVWQLKGAFKVQQIWRSNCDMITVLCLRFISGGDI